LNEGIKEGYSTKSYYFATIGLYSVKTFADTYRLAVIITNTGDALFRFINIDDLKRP